MTKRAKSKLELLHLAKEECPTCKKDIYFGYHCIACCCYVVVDALDSCLLCKGSLAQVKDNDGKIMRGRKFCGKCKITYHFPIHQKKLAEMEEAPPSFTALAINLHIGSHQKDGTNMEDVTFLNPLNEQREVSEQT